MHFKGYRYLMEVLFVSVYIPAFRVMVYTGFNSINDTCHTRKNISENKTHIIYENFIRN